MCNCPNCGVALKAPSSQFFIATRFGFVHNAQTGNCAPDVRSAEGFATWDAADKCAAALSRKGVFKYWAVVAAGFSTTCAALDKSSEV